MTHPNDGTITDPDIEQKDRTVIIRGSEWQRGEGHAISFLYSKATKKACCLGLAGDQIYGIPLESLAGFKSPETFMEDQARSVFVKYSEYHEDWACECESKFDEGRPQKAMPINDDMNTTDDEKIEKLRPIFALFDIEIDWRPEE